MHINLENITYQEEIETENSPKITKEIWRIVKRLLIKKTPGHDNFIDKFYQKFRISNINLIKSLSESLEGENFF